MKKTLLHIIFSSIFSICIYGQSEQDTKGLIDKLSWTSITCDHSYHTFIVNYQDSSVRELIKIGKPAIRFLLNSIEKPEKTVIIHMILTKIVEPERNNDYLPIAYIYKDCNILQGWHHFYNGLIWEWYSGINYSIENSEVEKVRKYWEGRIYENKKPIDFNIDSVFRELNSKDSKRYPCIDNRKYENNSSQIDIKELLVLINTKFPSSKFNYLFNHTGNDSILSRFDDCFYISFDTDGLELRFDKDSILTSLIFKPNYNGKLIYGIKMSDKKEIVEQKAGKPSEINNYGNEYWWYVKNGMGIDFYDNNKIKGLQINKK